MTSELEVWRTVQKWALVITVDEKDNFTATIVEDNSVNIYDYFCIEYTEPITEADQSLSMCC